MLLAAGAGTRFRDDEATAHKLFVTLDDDPRTVWERALDAALEADIGPVVVVGGAVTLPTARWHGALDGGRLRVVRTPRWELGQAASLAAGLAALDGEHVDAVLVGLADQPGIPAATWAAVAAAPDITPIVAARYAGRRGPHPIRLRRDVWPLLPTFGDEVARRLIAACPQWVTDLDCLGSFSDIDTVEDARAWNNCATNSR